MRNNDLRPGLAPAGAPTPSPQLPKTRLASNTSKPFEVRKRRGDGLESVVQQFDIAKQTGDADRVGKGGHSRRAALNNLRSDDKPPQPPPLELVHPRKAPRASDNHRHPTQAAGTSWLDPRGIQFPLTSPPGR